VVVDSDAAEAEAKKQREFAARDFLTNNVRLGQISYPLLKSAAAFCGDEQRSGIGVEVANKYMFPKQLHGAVSDMWGLDDELYIVGVSEDGPAARAGLRFGDRIVQIGEKEVKSGKKAADSFLKLMRSDEGSNEVLLTIERQEEILKVGVDPETVCDFNVLLSVNDSVNAFADGRNVFVTTGMIRFAGTDHELAVVLGHEIAHNAMDHVDKMRGNAAVGSFFDIVAAAAGVNTGGAFGNMAAGAFSQDFEAEADYVGLYLMARSGIHVDLAPDFWRKMAIAHPASIRNSHGASHPATPERFLALEETVREITEKQKAGAALEPNYKRGGKQAD
jgi:hypothetical protein